MTSPSYRFRPRKPIGIDNASVPYKKHKGRGPGAPPYKIFDFLFSESGQFFRQRRHEISVIRRAIVTRIKVPESESEAQNVGRKYFRGSKRGLFEGLCTLADQQSSATTLARASSCLAPQTRPLRPIFSHTSKPSVDYFLRGVRTSYRFVSF